ncbi:hypothetical protein PVAND_002999 [Polypedilum vanderplanki]|uniref:tRNA (uracil-O(2)-)-methyltransferase n=1 Tax=Polypedilum vanderplanki TaxID=319348 RepID=A0A9J6BSS8_POLVA|nr:hypothetical protein PVAND_002999 [Polypedilum vanderplanki]
MNRERENIIFSKELNKYAFYHAVHIYLKKPQVINRKLSCSNNLAFIEYNEKCEVDNVREIICNTLKNESLKNLEKELNNNFIEHKLKNLDALKDINVCKQVSIDRITAKNNISCFQITIIDKFNDRVSFYSLDNTSKFLPLINYTLVFKNNQLKLLVSEKDFENDACNWLRYALIKKLQNWMENYEEEGDDNKRMESHSLIDDEAYNKLYCELKQKHGKKLESLWVDESTDPKKFVYEDIAICAYLMTLWKKYREENKSDEKQTFLDFGCGNGLLVYLLNQEGHIGYGIDLRKRNIWDKFDPQVDLREKTWTPDENNFNDVDWIIGNHSDELSPWVPVVAYRSSYKCNYFLLPCCAYNFSGTKFERSDTSKSLYMGYIDYLNDISSTCGFNTTLIDRLKIPSTKRICLIGLNRSHDIENYAEQCEFISQFIKASIEQNKNFIPREKVPVVRNCTKIDKNLTEKIVKIIFDALMEEKKNKDTFIEEEEWNSGGELKMSDAVKLISQEDLKKLKAESGGLQTLLKNKHQIFDIRGGIIKIRKPKKITDIKISKKAQKKNAIKSSPCYFHLHHKQGCFLKSEDCCYIH